MRRSLKMMRLDVSSLAKFKDIFLRHLMILIGLQAPSHSGRVVKYIWFFCDLPVFSHIYWDLHIIVVFCYLHQNSVAESYLRLEKQFCPLCLHSLFLLVRCFIIFVCCLSLLNVLFIFFSLFQSSFFFGTVFHHVHWFVNCLRAPACCLCSACAMKFSHCHMAGAPSLVPCGTDSSTRRMAWEPQREHKYQLITVTTFPSRWLV